MVGIYIHSSEYLVHSFFDFRQLGAKSLPRIIAVTFGADTLTILTETSTQAWKVVYFYY